MGAEAQVEEEEEEEATYPIPAAAPKVRWERRVTEKALRSMLRWLLQLEEERTTAKAAEV